MNLHYMVEEAFGKLENAIAYAELHDSTSAADAERYAQLLDDIVGLRDGVKKETAPAVGATEAAKKDSSKESTSSVAENGGDVNPRGSLNIQIIDQDSIKSTLRSRHKNDLARIYAAATEVCIVSAAENGFMPEYIDVARKMGEKAALRRLTDTALDLLKSMVGGTGK